MIDGPAVAKKLSSSNEKHQLSALLYLSNFLNTTGDQEVPGMLIPSLEQMFRGGDLPMKHRVLLYGIARRSTLLHSPLLAVIISDLDDNTINDPACLAAASNALSILPSENILNFFARPGNEDGMYSCEESAEAITRCISHEDPRVRSATINGFTRAAVRAYGAVYGKQGLENVSSNRGFESWATAVRFRDVLHDQCGELLNKLANLVCVDKEEVVVAAAATALHHVIMGATNIGDIKHEGDEYWELDGSRFLLVDILRGVNHKEMAGAEWAEFTTQAARGLFDLTQKVLGSKESKLESLQQRALQSSPGSMAHPSLLHLGSDIILLRLFFQGSAKYNPKAAALMAVDWAERVLAGEACGEVSNYEDSIAGNAELLRLLHLPCLRSIRGMLANSVFETSMAATRGALVQTKKQTEIAYQPLLYHHLSGELLSSEDTSLVACALTALPWTATHTHLFASRFSRCLRLVAMIEELPVRCGMMSALAATMVTNPTQGVRSASAVAYIFGSAQTLAILQDRAPRKLSQELDSSQLRHELASALLNACSHSFRSTSNAVVFGIPKVVYISDRLEQLRWAEVATVLLTKEFKGWKLSECLSWYGVDGANCTSSESFPSASAPLAFVKLLAQTMLAVNRARLVEFNTASHLSEEEEASIRTEIVAINESLESLESKDSAAKSAGELEVSEALQRKISEGEASRQELMRSLQTPADQWSEGWNAVGDAVSKLCRDLVVWTLGRGLADRGVTASLLALLADQWSLLTDKKVEVSRDRTPARIAQGSLGRDSTPESSSSFDGKWGVGFGDRPSHSTGRSDSMSQDSFEDCDDMSFSENVSSEDLAREIIRELFHAQPCLKYEGQDVSDKESKGNKGHLGGGCCSRAISPPCASLPYHHILIAAALRLSVTSPQTGSLFLSAFTSRIHSAKCALQGAQKTGSTLGGFEDTSSEIETSLQALSRAVKKLSTHSVQRRNSDSTPHTLPPSTSMLDSFNAAAVAQDATVDMFAPPVDFFGSDTLSSAPEPGFGDPVSPYSTPPHITAALATPPRTPQTSLSQPTAQDFSKQSLVLMDCALATCDRGFTFGEHFWNLPSDRYATTLIQVFDSQLSGGRVIPGCRTGVITSVPLGGCIDPLVGTLSVEVSDRLLVNLVVHNATACVLNKVGAHLLGHGRAGPDCEQLPAGASVRFHWALPLTATPIDAQVYYQNLELEVNSDSEEEAEESILDNGEEDEDVDDMNFGGDDGGGGGSDIPGLLMTFLPTAQIQLPTASLLHSARFTRSALLTTWSQLPYSQHLNCTAPSLDALLALSRVHAAALVPTSGDSDTMKFFSFAWKMGNSVVIAVLSAVLSSQRVNRPLRDIFVEVRTKLKISPEVAHNNALGEVARMTAATTQDPDQLVRHAAAFLHIDSTRPADPKWQVEVEVRCGTQKLLQDLLVDDASPWLQFLGGGVLARHFGVPLTLAKNVDINVAMIGHSNANIKEKWQKLREERNKLRG